AGLCQRTLANRRDHAASAGKTVSFRRPEIRSATLLDTRSWSNPIMRYHVLGGAGFIGSAVVYRLLLDKHAVRVFVRPDVKPYRSFGPQEQVDWVGGDLQNAQEVAAALKDVDTVFHLVSTTLPKNSNDDPIYDVQTNLVATLQLLQAMV